MSDDPGSHIQTKINIKEEETIQSQQIQESIKNPQTNETLGIDKKQVFQLLNRIQTEQPQKKYIFFPSKKKKVTFHNMLSILSEIINQKN